MTRCILPIVLLVMPAVVVACEAPSATNGSAAPESNARDVVPTTEIEWPLKEMYVRLRRDADLGRTVYEYRGRTMTSREELQGFLAATQSACGMYSLTQLRVRFDVAGDVPWRDVSDAVLDFKTAGFTDVGLLVPFPFDAAPRLTAAEALRAADRFVSERFAHDASFELASYPSRCARYNATLKCWWVQYEHEPNRYPGDHFGVRVDDATGHVSLFGGA